MGADGEEDDSLECECDGEDRQDGGPRGEVKEPGEEKGEDGCRDCDESPRDGAMKVRRGLLEPRVEGGGGDVLKARGAEEGDLFSEGRERRELLHAVLAFEDLLRLGWVEKDA